MLELIKTFSSTDQLIDLQIEFYQLKANEQQLNKLELDL